MKNILVTGGSGFIGSNFIEYLFSLQEFTGNIINLDKITYAGNLANTRKVEKAYPNRYKFIGGDICSPDCIAQIFSKFSIDTVCHFAAESHVDRSIASPEDFIFTNIVGTFNLLEEARKNSVHLIRFHHVSTDEVYGSLGDVGKFREGDPYCPNNPYSASKASSDFLVRSYWATYNLPITISNCSNNYGPYQFPEKLIPLVILNALKGKSLPIYGDGKNVRDWLYVEDHCRAIWLVMKEGSNGETYNVGGDAEVQNIDLVKMICDIIDEVVGINSEIGPRLNLITFVKDRPGHDKRYAIDFSKIRRNLGWEPKGTFQDNLRKTVLWYLNNKEWVQETDQKCQMWLKNKK